MNTPIYHSREEEDVSRFRPTDSTKANTGSNCCTLVLNLIVPFTLIISGSILVSYPSAGQRNDIRVAYIIIGIFCLIISVVNIGLTLFFHVMDTIRKGSFTIGLIFIPLSIINLLGPCMLLFGGIALLSDVPPTFGVGIASIFIGSLILLCELLICLMFCCACFGGCFLIIKSAFGKKRERFLVEDDEHSEMSEAK
eukprot:gene778-9028_t